MRNDVADHAWQEPGGDGLVAEVERIGVRALTDWRARCGWCRSSSACRGDPYLCAYVTAEVEPELRRG